MISIRRTFVLISLSFLLVVAAVLAEKPDNEIKFASVAPEGSAWMKQMEMLDTEVREATGGSVGFKLYAGGVQGDEPDVLRKIRFGQLHAGGFTGNGMGEILPAARILELPFLYRDKAEIDYVLAEFTDRFDQEFREKGYVLLGWTEVGYVYFFSNKPITSIDDLRKMKVWTWQGDPLAAAMFDAMRVTPVPLSLPEVMTALQTGMVDAVYVSPMAAVSTGWFTRTKYMNVQPLTNSMGAVLLSKRLWDKLDTEEQQILLASSRKHLRELTLLTREQNKESLEQLEKAGIEMLPPPGPDTMQEYERIGIEVRQELTDDLYSEQLLEDVKAALERYRTEIAPAQEQAEAAD